MRLLERSFTLYTSLSVRVSDKYRAERDGVGQSGM